VLEDWGVLPMLITLYLCDQTLALKVASALAFLYRGKVLSPRGARVPTRHHCSNRSNAALRDTQEHTVAPHRQKKRSQELLLRRIGRPRITEIGRGFFAGVCRRNNQPLNSQDLPPTLD
jgi:hypothetical protein